MFRKILYPTDFSDSANAALSYVKKLKEAGAEEVILLARSRDQTFKLTKQADKKEYPIAKPF